MDGRQADAITLYRDLVREDPTGAGAWHNLGVAFLMTGESSDAVASLKRAVALDPKDLLGGYLLALSLLQAGDWASATTETQRVRELKAKLIADTVTRLGMPSYEGIDLRVVGPSFDDKLAKIEEAAKNMSLLTQAQVIEFAALAFPALANRRA